VSRSALIVVDMLNTYDHPDAEKMMELNMSADVSPARDRG
jgi:hypothetical protein